MMTPIRTHKNQYRGINAHLHSYWQAAGKWNRFHSAHITDLERLLKQQLIPLGYTAEIEESLQLWRAGKPPKYPQADLLIRDLEPHRAGTPRGAAVLEAEVGVLALDDLIDEAEFNDHEHVAIGVYELRDQPTTDEPIAWIELLSPTNKDGMALAIYQAKCYALLQAGRIFIELDYLHHTPATFEVLPSYPAREAHAQPYRILILDPRPAIRGGVAYHHTFHVDEPLPTLKLPLSGTDFSLFDFDAAYQKTFTEGLYGFDRELNYHAYPAEFARYSPADQQRIAARLVAILQAQQQGSDLEAAPFPVDPTLTLESAQAQLAQYGVIAAAIG
jgi:hypothetical protein